MDQFNVQRSLGQNHFYSLLESIDLFESGISLTSSFVFPLKSLISEISCEELSEEFPNEPLSISVHPNGLFLSISFFNLINIYIYTIDRLILIKQLNIPNARMVVLIDKKKI